MRRNVILTVLALAVVSTAHAISQLSYEGPLRGGHLKISLDYGDNYHTVFGGELLMELCDTNQRFWAYCTSADVGMRTEGCWGVDVLDTDSLSPNGARVGYLVTTYGATIHAGGTNKQARMLAAVLWELVTETSGAYDLTHGSFRVRQGDGDPLSSSELAQAQVYLDDLGQGVAVWYRSHRDHHNHKLSQDVVTPVPEPAAAIALATGLLALLRRRSRA